jgi:hypothetical protein
VRSVSILRLGKTPAGAPAARVSKPSGTTISRHRASKVVWVIPRAGETPAPANCPSGCAGQLRRLVKRATREVARPGEFCLRSTSSARQLPAAKY